MIDLRVRKDVLRDTICWAIARYGNRAVIAIAIVALLIFVAYTADLTGYRRGACSAIHAENDETPSCIGIGDDGLKEPGGVN